MDDVAGGGSVLALAEQEFGWVAGLLDQASYDDATGCKLYVALAELGQLCGWSAYDAGHQGLAQRYFVAALRAAHSADDRPFGAHILQALAFATLRDTSACMAAMSRARTQVEQLKPDDDPPWLYWLDPANVALNAGACLLQLGQADQAAAMLREGFVQFSESFIRDQQITITYLADALARPGRQRDLDAAAGLGMQSIDLAESLDSNRGAGHLHDLYCRMKPYAKVPAVRDFLERARGFARLG